MTRTPWLQGFHPISQPRRTPTTSLSEAEFRNRLHALGGDDFVLTLRRGEIVKTILSLDL
jgi:hypothetical protein